MNRYAKPLSIPYLFVLLSALSWTQAKPGTLRQEVERLRVDTVLLIPSQAVDERPVWSPDSRFLAANLTGIWYTVDTSELEFQHATWRKQTIAVPASEPKLEKAKPETVEAWRKDLVQGPREVTTKSGMTISLTQKTMSTHFIIQEKGKRARTLWQTDLENCHSLAISPDQRFVAFICELNGVVVSDLTRLGKDLRDPQYPPASPPSTPSPR